MTEAMRHYGRGGARYCSALTGVSHRYRQVRQLHSGTSKAVMSSVLPARPSIWHQWYDRRWFNKH